MNNLEKNTSNYDFEYDDNKNIESFAENTEEFFKAFKIADDNLKRKTLPCDHDLTIIKDLIYDKLDKNKKDIALNQIDNCLYCSYSFEDFYALKKLEDSVKNNKSKQKIISSSNKIVKLLDFKEYKRIPYIFIFTAIVCNLILFCGLLKEIENAKILVNQLDITNKELVELKEKNASLLKALKETSKKKTSMVH
jgi:hypothetical protein